MSQLPIFETKRLILKAVELSDEPAYTRHFVNYEVIRNLSHTVPWPYPANGVSNYLKTDILPQQGNDKWVWGIFMKDAPTELVGAVELLRKSSPANRGFWLAQHLWGQGIMTEAVEPVMNYAFDELGFEELIFSNAVDNKRSGRVKEKTGAMFMGREPAAYVDPRFTERELYKLTKAEWEKFKMNEAF